MAHQGGDEDGDSDDETGRPAGTLGDLFGLSATNHGLRTWRHPDGSFSVQYCLSVASTMHGDKLWPASQVLACLLGDTEGDALGLALGETDGALVSHTSRDTSLAISGFHVDPASPKVP